MPKILMRIVALFLTPCLLTGSLQAIPFPTNQRTIFAGSLIFTSQALAAEVVNVKPPIIDVGPPIGEAQQARNLKPSTAPIEHQGKKTADEIAADLQAAFQTAAREVGEYVREILFYGGLAEGRYGLDDVVDDRGRDLDLSVPIVDERERKARERPAALFLRWTVVVPDVPAKPEDTSTTLGMDFGIGNLIAQIARQFRNRTTGRLQKTIPVPVVRTGKVFHRATASQTWELIFPAFLHRRLAWFSGGSVHSILLSEGALFCNYIVVWDILQNRAVLIHTMVQERRQAKVVMIEALEYLEVDLADKPYIRDHIRSIIVRPNTFAPYTTLLSWLVNKAFAAEIDDLGMVRLNTDWSWRWYLGKVAFSVYEKRFYALNGSRTLDLNNRPPTLSRPAAPAARGNHGEETKLGSST